MNCPTCTFLAKHCVSHRTFTIHVGMHCTTSTFLAKHCFSYKTHINDTTFWVNIHNLHMDRNNMTTCNKALWVWEGFHTLHGHTLRFGLHRALTRDCVCMCVWGLLRNICDSLHCNALLFHPSSGDHLPMQAPHLLTNIRGTHLCVHVFSCSSNNTSPWLCVCCVKFK